jgi:hypothetical protein
MLCVPSLAGHKTGDQEASTGERGPRVASRQATMQMCGLDQCGDENVPKQEVPPS